MTASILPQPGQRSLRDYLCGLATSDREKRLDELSPNALLSLPWLFEHWAIADHQLPPAGDWSTWVILGGRGAGKTRAGSEWIRSEVEGAKPRDPGRVSRVALIGETIDQAREVMIFGESGILACSPADRRPQWQSSRKRLVWPNGASAQAFSANDPESLRGPQFDCAWCDEVGKWRKAQDAWDMLQFGLRLGDAPRCTVTTTPRPNKTLIDILEDPRTVTTSAATEANRMHLAETFLASVTARYGNSRLGRQELSGELLLDREGALWSRGTLEHAASLGDVSPTRVVVAVDPPVTSGSSADECGIVVVGVDQTGPPQNWRACVIEDGSLSGASPQAWAKRAVDLYHAHQADRLVAEVNQGGDMVSALIRQVDPMVSFRGVRASRGKIARAEPIAALYEQGRVVHRVPFPQLEDQMAEMTSAGFMGRGSPDRVDALVWALTELMIDPALSFRRPKVRSL